MLNLILHLPCHSKSTCIALRWAVKTNRTADGTWNQLCLCVERLLKMSFLFNFVLLKIAANRIHEMNTCANVTCEKVCRQILIISPNQVIIRSTRHFGISVVLQTHYNPIYSSKTFCAKLEIWNIHFKNYALK